MNQDLEWLDIVEGAESKVWKKSFSGAGELEIYTADTPENIDLLQTNRYVVRQDDISILAPSRGATGLVYAGYNRTPISILAPARGATR